MSDAAASTGSEAWEPPSLSGAGAGVGVGAGTRAADHVPVAGIEDVTAAREEARREGFETGYAEGLAAGRARGESLAAELQTLLSSLATPLAELDGVLLQELTTLLERVAEAVLQRELREDSNIQQVLQQALAVLGEAEAPVELQVHPDDAALLRESGFAQDPRYRVVEDPRMLRGGAQLRAAGSFVDASVEQRLEALMVDLRGELSLPEAPEPGAESAGDG